MRRPLFWLGLVFSLVTAAAYFSPAVAACVAAVVIATRLIYHITHLRRWDSGNAHRTRLGRIGSCAVAAGALAALASFALFEQRVLRPYNEYNNMNMRITGTVLSGRAAGSAMVYTVKGRIIDAPGGSVHYDLLTFNEIVLKVGESFEGTARIAPKALDDDYGAYSLSAGVVFSAYLRGEPVVLDRPLYPASAFFARFRAQFAKNLITAAPGSGTSMLVAMLVGDFSGVSAAEREVITQAGLAHAITISGMHLSVFAALVLRLFSRSEVAQLHRLPFVLVAVWLLVPISGMGYPVLRAAIMLTLHYAARLLSRIEDALTSLSLSALIILLINPLAIGSLSFVASTLATYTLVLFAEPIEKRFTARAERLPHVLRPVAKAAGSIMAAGLAAQVSMLPLFYITTGTLNLASLPSGLLALPLMGMTIASGYIAGLCGFVAFLAPLAKLLILPARFGMWLFYLVARAFAALPLDIYINHAIYNLWLVLAAALLAWHYGAKHPGWLVRFSAVMCAVLLMFAQLCTALLERGTLRVVSLPNTQGVLFVQQGHAVVVGGLGTPKESRETLRRYGVRQVDVLIFMDSSFAAGAGAGEFILAHQPQLVIAPDEPVARAYLSATAAGEVAPLGSMSLKFLCGVDGWLDPRQGLLVHAGDTYLLKNFESYDILNTVQPFELAAFGGGIQLPERVLPDVYIDAPGAVHAIGNTTHYRVLGGKELLLGT